MFVIVKPLFSRRASNSRSLSPWMRNRENHFLRQGIRQSGFQREERRGRSPTQRRLFATNSGLRSQSPTMGDVHSQTIFTRDLQTHHQALDYDSARHLEGYNAGRSPQVSGVERIGRNPPAGQNGVPTSPAAANANRRRRRRRGGRRPSCPRGGVQRAVNGAAWEVSRRYSASNVDGMDNEAAEDDLQEEDFFPGHYDEQLERMQPEPENPALPLLGSHLISTIATTARDINVSSANNVQAVLDALQGKTHLLSTEELMSKDSLASLAARCERADQTAQAADVVYMLSCMELRAKVIRYVCLFACYLINVDLIYLYQHFPKHFNSKNYHPQKD